MTWDNQWESIHRSNDWGMFPCEFLVRVLAKKYQKKLKKKLNVIELGCGVGANLSLYNEYCQNFIGIDNSEIAISKIEKNAKKFKKCNFNFLKGNVMDINYSNFDFKFDMIVDVECLYCLSNQDAKTVIDNVSKNLSIDGQFFSLMFNEETNLNLLRNIKGMKLRKESDIYEIFNSFKKISLEKTIRTFNQRTSLISEFIIVTEDLKFKK